MRYEADLSIPRLLLLIVEIRYCDTDRIIISSYLSSASITTSFSQTLGTETAYLKRLMTVLLYVQKHTLILHDSKTRPSSVKLSNAT